VPIIGIWKIVGVIAILIQRFKLVKEKAYAGFFFFMCGWLFSHIESVDSISKVAPALVLLKLIVVSWYHRPADRKIISVNH